MTKWHKITPDDLPKENEWVIVSRAINNGERYTHFCMVATLYKSFMGVKWMDGEGFISVHDTDRWAYIELPED